MLFLYWRSYFCNLKAIENWFKLVNWRLCGVLRLLLSVGDGFLLCSEHFQSLAVYASLAPDEWTDTGCDHHHPLELEVTWPYHTRSMQINCRVACLPSICHSSHCKLHSAPSLRLNWKADIYRQQRVKKKLIKTREIASWPYQETKDKAKKLRRDTNTPKQ